MIPNPRELLINKETPWNDDGPSLPIEYARISRGNRLTLVLYDKAEPISTLWSIMLTNKLDVAKENLRIREGMNSTRQIGFVDLVRDQHSDFSDTKDIAAVTEWARSKSIDAVIWTGLKSNFESKLYEIYGGQRRPVNIENINWFLNKLSSKEFNNVKDYILSTPKSTITGLRMSIESVINNFD